MVVDILKDGSESLDILNRGFAVVAAAATSNEVVKELFMELKIDELILEALNIDRVKATSEVYMILYVFS